MVIVIIFVLGLCLGSFVNALVWRFYRQADLQDELAELAASKSKKVASQAIAKQQEISDISIARGRSMCVHCRHELVAKDLIPVVSYLMLGGKCRYCRAPIQDTPLAELATPALFIASYSFWPMQLNGAGLVSFCFWLVFLVGLVALAIYDIRWFELPHRIVLPLIGLAIVETCVVAGLFGAGEGGGWQHLRQAGFGALIGGGLFYLLYQFSPKEVLEDGTKISKWIGGGDITLGVLLGLLVGGPSNALLLIFVASLLGTAVAVPLMVMGKAQRTSHLPFGPYLILAAVIVMLWGERIIGWYLGQFTV